MKDAGIVRNRAKIEGTVRRRAGLSRDHGERPGLLDAAVGLRRRQAEGQPVQDHASRCRPRRRCRNAISKELAARGFKFVGPTIVYAFMQAVGMVNDHLVTCHRHETCASSAQARSDSAARPHDRASDATSAQRAPGSACCRAAGSTCSTPRRSTSRSRTSRTASPASRAGTGRPAARISSRSRSTRCWSRPCCAQQMPRARPTARGWRCCCTTRRNMSSAT